MWIGEKNSYFDESHFPRIRTWNLPLELFLCCQSLESPVFFSVANNYNYKHDHFVISLVNQHQKIKRTSAQTFS